MKQPFQMSKTAVLVEGALMVALAFVLSLVKFSPFPWGGSITAASTLPIIMMSLRHGAKWGVGVAGVFSLLQMLLGMPYVVGVPVNTVFYMVLCALLDYVLPYTVLGFTGGIAARFKSKMAGVAVGIAVTGFFRFLCSFFSGLIIWNQWTWNNWPVWLHSLVYNMGWCLPDVLIVLVAALLLEQIKKT